MRRMAAGVVGMIVLAGALARLVDQACDTGPQQMALVADMLRLEADPMERPVHVDAPEHVEGRAAAWSKLAGATAALTSDEHAVTEIVDGMRSYDDLPAAAGAVLAQYDDAVGVMLRGTHAGGARAPGTLNILTSFEANPDLRPFFTLTKLTGLRIRRALATNDAQRAAADCLDGLALGRDLTWNHGALGMMMGLRAQTMLLAPCRAAILSLPRDARRRAVASFRVILDGIASVDHVMHEEDVWTRVHLFGVLLSPEIRAAMPPGLAAQAAESRCVEPVAFSGQPMNATMGCGLFEEKLFRMSWSRIDELLALRRDLLHAAAGRGSVASIPAYHNPYAQAFVTGLHKMLEWDEGRRAQLARVEEEYRGLAAD